MSEQRMLAGRYRLDVVIGRGGMGTVWRGFDLRLDRRVAVKELRLPTHLSDAEAAEVTAMAVAEGRRSAQLVHPHIVTTFDVVDEGDKPWLVMQLVEGRSLAQVIAEQGRLPVSRVAQIGAQVLSAIMTAHAAGVIHRDVKPANVLIADTDGKALLSDFSIAKVLGDGTTGSTTGTMAGSPGFIAPELILTGRVGPEGDLFGLGASLFEATEGYGAFARDQPIAGLFATANSPHPPLQHAAQLAPVIDGLLVKDPDHRMRAAEALTALTEVATGQVGSAADTVPLNVPDTIIRRGRSAGADESPATAGGGTAAAATTHLLAPPSTPPTLTDERPAGRRVPRRVLLVVGAAVAAATGTAVVLGSRHAGGRPAPPTGSTTPSPPTSPSAAVAVLTGHTSWVESVAFSPDGATLASASYDRTIRLWNVASGIAVGTFTGHSDNVRSVAFSPDGTMLASGSADGTVRLWNVATHRAFAILTGHSDTVFEVAFSPDGTTLASSSADNTVRLWKVATHASLAVLTGHTGGVATVAYSPDRKTLATGSYDRTIRLWSLATRATAATLTGHTGTVFSVAYHPDGTILASGGNDHTVRLWDTTRHAAGATLSGHGDAVHSVAFSPDGKTLASGSADRTIRLWNPVTGAVLATLTGHGNTVFSVAFSPDGTTLASGSSDRTIRLWKLPATG